MLWNIPRMMSCTGETLPMSAPKVMMVLRLSMLLFIISTGSRLKGCVKSVHVQAFELSWLVKCGREVASRYGQPCVVT